MIVFLEPDKQILRLYTEKGMEIFEFDEVDDLVKQIGKQKVLYITNAIETTGNMILETVNQMIKSSAGSSNNQFDELDQQTYYLQSLSKGVVHIQDINVTFEGPGDCKLIDEEMAELIQQSVILRQMMKKNPPMIRIVDYAEMRKSSRKQQKNKEKFQKLRQAAKDRELDSIIVKTDRPGSAEMLASGMFSGDSDVQTTDITDSIINDPTENMTEEELNEAIRLGKLAP